MQLVPFGQLEPFFMLTSRLQHEIGPEENIINFQWLHVMAEWGVGQGHADNRTLFPNNSTYYLYTSVPVLLCSIIFLPAVFELFSIFKQESIPT